MVLSKLRNLKEVQKNYRKKNNLPKEQRNILNKLNSLVKNRHIIICSSDKDGKIVILNYEYYNSIMLRELKDFETVMMVGCTISEHFEQIRETCNSLMIKLHKLKIVNDCMLLHTTASGVARGGRGPRAALLGGGTLLIKNKFLKGV